MSIFATYLRPVSCCTAAAADVCCCSPFLFKRIADVSGGAEGREQVALI
jgi:hypothetical protein